MHAVKHPTELFLGMDLASLQSCGAEWTAREICQQPEMLRATGELLQSRKKEIEDFVAPILKDPAARVVFTGAGTSAFIGECLQPLLGLHVEAAVDAVPTTDIVSAPALYLDPDQPLLLVSFGRSGNSPESIATVELAERLVKHVRHLVITCNAAGALAKADVRNALMISLPEATHDRSFAMTSSFSCMMYAAYAILRGIEVAGDQLEQIAHATDAAIAQEDATMQRLAENVNDRVVYLGSHAFKGLAREAALKLGELSNGAVVSTFDSPLGFRHGPKTIVTDNTLVMVFVSNNPLTARYDQDLVDELRNDALAARVVAIRARSASAPHADDIVLTDLADADDSALLWPYIALAQMYAFHAAVELGRSPDNPNPQGTVNRVVQGVRIHSES